MTLPLLLRHSPRACDGVAGAASGHAVWVWCTSTNQDGAVFTAAPSGHLPGSLGQPSMQECPFLPQPQQTSFSVLAIFFLEPSPLLLRCFTAPLRPARLPTSEALLPASHSAGATIHMHHCSLIKLNLLLKSNLPLMPSLGTLTCSFSYKSSFCALFFIPTRSFLSIFYNGGHSSGLRYSFLYYQHYK